MYVKVKAEKSWRFWGLYVHVCKLETLESAYALAKKNNGAPGLDGVTFEAIEEGGVEAFLLDLQAELVSETYRPSRNRRQEIPKGNGKVRVLGIPCIRDRVVQGALKLILEPIFETDFQPGSYGYRPKRTAHQAVRRVAEAIVHNKTQVIDVDLASYFDTIRHDLLLGKVAQRVRDDQVLRLLRLILKSGGKRGVPQGAVISPLMSHLYLTEVDQMLERAKEVTRQGRFTYVEYARFADDLVILIDGYRKWDWLAQAVSRRLLEELTILDVQLNHDKTRWVNLAKGESFHFLGFAFHRVKTRQGAWGVSYAPTLKARTALLSKLRDIFRRFRSQPVDRLIALINPILRGWVNYFRVGHASRCFGYVKDWVEKKVRQQMMRARQRQGFGWKRWSRSWLYDQLGLYNGYRVVQPWAESAPSR
jgi:RNA-directed DNA polymerase